MPNEAFNKTNRTFNKTDSTVSFNENLVLTFISIQILFCILSVLTNALVLFVRFKIVTVRKVINPLLVNLAVIDMLTGFSFLYQVFFYYYPELSTIKTTCLLRYQIIIFFSMSSYFTILALAFDRYFFLFHNSKHQFYTNQSDRVYLLSIVIINAVSSVYFLYPFFGLNMWSPRKPCIFPLINQGSFMLFLSLSVWIVSLACLVIYTCIYHAVSKKKRQTLPILSVTGSTESSGRLREQIAARRRELKTLRTSVTINVVFAICWLPFSVIEFLHFLTPWTPLKTMIGSSLVFLGAANSFVNPIIYTILRPEFRLGLIKLFSRQSGQCHAH